MTEWSNRERKKQIIDFSGLKIGSSTPTDIDCASEWHGIGFCTIEVKHRSTEIPFGQALFYKRLTDTVRQSGKEALFILAEHEVDDCAQDIDISKCKVRFFYYEGKSYKYDGDVLSLYTKFIEHLEWLEELISDYFYMKEG